LGTPKEVILVGVAETCPSPGTARGGPPAGHGPGLEGPSRAAGWNADASPGVSVRAELGASLPALGWLATELLVGGTVLTLIACALILIPVRMAATRAEDPAVRS